MGATIWLQIKKGGQVTGGDRDNTIMLRLDQELDALAAELAVTPLSSLRVWSDSALGYKTVSAVLRSLEENPLRIMFPSDPSRADWPELLLQELRYCHEGLRVAAEERCRFRFRIVS